MKKRLLSCLVLLLVLPTLFIASKGIERIKIVLKERSASSIALRLMEELSSEGQISVDTKRNAIVVVDDLENIEKIKNLVEELDVPPRKFAISAVLSIYPQKRESIFKKSPKFFDVEDLAFLTETSEKYEAMTDLEEGSKGKMEFKSSPYFIDIQLGGYDPTIRKIHFENIELFYKENGKSDSLFKLKANLQEGVETAILVSRKSNYPPVRLGINPTLLPQILEKKEHP